jgi:hypothetical protein
MSNQKTLLLVYLMIFAFVEIHPVLFGIVEVAH